MEFSHLEQKAAFSLLVGSGHVWRARAVQLLLSAALVLRDAVQARDAFLNLPLDEASAPDIATAQLQIRIANWNVGFFLAALATENLLKELWIRQNPVGVVTHVRDDLGKHFGHDQVVLAEECRLELTEDERALLICFKDQVEWAGRYPTPMKQENFQQYLRNGGNHAWTLFRQATSEDPLSPLVSAFTERVMDASDKLKANAEGAESRAE